MIDFAEPQPYTDIEIVAGGKRLYFYKILLSLHSDVFAAMLSGKMTESANDIISLDFDSLAIGVFLNYLYEISGRGLTDKTKDDIQQHIFESLELSERFMISSLKEICEDYLTDYIGDFLQADNLNIICRYDLKDFKWHLRENLSEVFKMEDFGKLMPHVITEFSFSCSTGEYYELIDKWIQGDPGNARYLADILQQDVIKKSSLKYDQSLSRLLQRIASDDPLRMVILEHLSDNYMKFRRIAIDIIPSSEFDSKLDIS